MPARTGTMISSRRMKYLVTYRAGGLDMAPRPPIVRRAPAKPWRSSGLTFAVPVLEVPEVRVPADRKSTRLNSSHITISYAVFCLKKKKKKHIKNNTKEITILK